MHNSFYLDGPTLKDFIPKYSRTAHELSLECHTLGFHSKVQKLEPHHMTRAFTSKKNKETEIKISSLTRRNLYLCGEVPQLFIPAIVLDNVLGCTI